MNNTSSQDRKLGGYAHFIPRLVLLCMGGFFLILYTTRIAGALHSNIAWVNFNAHVRDEASVPKNMAQELELFAKAIELDGRNRSAWFGLGMSNALEKNIDTAINIWIQSSTDPAMLITYGFSARNKGDLDVALTHFRAADALDKNGTWEGYALAGTVCQRTYAIKHILSKSNIQYCSDYLAGSGGNFIVNGDFSTRALCGWEGEHFFSGQNPARLRIEEPGESVNSIVSLEGLDVTNHFGLYQPLTLNPGTAVRFSGRFKLSGKENLTARLLYIGWQSEDGTPQGNHVVKRNKQMEWTEFERIFRVPEDSKLTFNFYPVTFSGEGKVWFDDIQLELVTD